MSNNIYDDLEQADGNDLIEELENLRDDIIHDSNNKSMTKMRLGDLENIVRQLTINEEC